MVSFSNNTHLDTGLHFLLHMAGGTLAQESVIRFRSSCNVCGGVAYTRCLMYPHRKKSNLFVSNKRTIWDRPRSFEISDDEDDAWAAIPVSAECQLEDDRPAALDLGDLQWRWVSNLKLSGPEAEILPPGHRGPVIEMCL
ncbi:hypothetical protein AVEN_61204-1, partial [Araneus ventricosus]